MIAITIIFAAMVAMAYTATLGFHSIAYGRERVTADGIADQIMETIRGQAYSKIQTGLSSSDLTDPNIANCGGTPIVYRFQSCSGERIVNSGGVPSTPWINPHTGTIAATATTNNIAFNWQTYVTNDCPSVTATCPAMTPYRVTVMISWTSAAYPNKANNLVQIQSLFSSPSGCLSSSTHPFAAPCQPSFYGLAQVPAAHIDISGSIQGLNNFTSGYLGLTGTESNLQNEQVTVGRASFSESQVSVTDGAGTRTDAGTLTTASAADSDPGAPALTYGTSLPVSGLGGAVSSTNGSTSIDLERHRMTPAWPTPRSLPGEPTSARPRPIRLRPITSLASAGGSSREAPLTASMTLNGLAGGLGTAALASVDAAASNPNTSFVNRQVDPGKDGSVAVGHPEHRPGEHRRLPGGGRRAGRLDWLPALDDRIPGQRDLPGGVDDHGRAGGRPVGRHDLLLERCKLHLSLGDRCAAQQHRCASRDPDRHGRRARCHGDHLGELGIQAATSGSTRTCTPSATLTQCTAEDSSVTPFKATVHYVVIVDGATAINLNIAINMGTMLTRSVYAPAPAAG